MRYFQWLDREGDRMAAEERRTRYEDEMHGISRDEAQAILNEWARATLESYLAEYPVNMNLTDTKAREK